MSRTEWFIRKMGAPAVMGATAAAAVDFAGAPVALHYLAAVLGGLLGASLAHSFYTRNDRRDRP